MQARRTRYLLLFLRGDCIEKIALTWCFHKSFPAPDDNGDNESKATKIPDRSHHFRLVIQSGVQRYDAMQTQLHRPLVMSMRHCDETTSAQGSKG